MLDRSDRLFCNGYSVSLRASDSSLWTIESLQRLLNSDVMHYYARLTSFQIAGGFQCYQKNFIAPFGVPSIDERQAEKLRKLDAEHLQPFICEELYGVEFEDVSEFLTSD